MAIQVAVGKPNKRLSYFVPKLSGGINNTSADSLIVENQLSLSENMVYIADGVLETRKGTEWYDAVDLGVVDYMDTYHPTGQAVKLVRGSANELYVDGELVKSVAGSVDGNQFFDRYYFVDGDKYYVYGKFPNSSSPHIISTGWVDEYKVLEIITPPTFTELDDTYTEGVWQYNFTTGKAWYEPCKLELDDIYKGANVIPSNPSLMTAHGNRLYMSGDDGDVNNVFITDITNPFYCPVTLPLSPTQNGDRITAIATFMDTVVVGRNKDVYVIYGNTNRNTSTQYQLKKFNTHTGFMNNHSWDSVNNYLFYLGSDGIAYRMHTTQTNNDILATAILSQNADFRLAPIQSTEEELKSAHSFYSDDVWYLTIGNKTMTYSYRYYGWGVLVGLDANIFYKFDDKLLVGRNDGRTTKFNNGHKDIYSPIICKQHTKRYDFDESARFKQYRNVYIVLHTFDEFKSKVEMRFEIDYNDVNRRVDIVNQLSRWGKMKFGDRLINREITRSEPISIGQRGRLFKVKLSSGEVLKNEFVDSAEKDAYTGMVLDELSYVISEDKYYRYNGSVWVEELEEDLITPMRVYDINIEYELRGYR